MADYAHEQTDKELAELEKKITEVYGQAYNEMNETVTEYFESFKTADAEQQKLLESGQITQDEYNSWRQTQIARGERYSSMAYSLAERYENADEVATAYINDATPSVYSLNRNYADYTIEQVGDGIDFNLWDEATVRRLIKDNPSLMPNYPEEKAIARGYDLNYGLQQIYNSTMSGILQGKSLARIANDLMNRINTMSRASAIRSARTAFTAAENGGRQDSYNEAAEMGLDMEKVWLATLDDRTRESHRHADFQVVPYNEPFDVGGEKMMFPADAEHGASGWNIYNCRCTMFEKPKGMSLDDFERWARDPETGNKELVNGMSYDDWLKSKEGQTAEEEESLTQVTNREEARKALSDVVGFDYVEDSFNRMNEQLAVANVNQLIKLEDKFGIIHESDYTSFANENYKDAIAYVQPMTSEPSNQTLSLCAKEYNRSYDDFVSMEKSSVQSGWSMPCATTNEELSVYAVTHEYGHMIQEVLCQQEMESRGWTQETARDYYNWNGKTKKARTKWYTEAKEAVYNECYSEIMDIAKENNSDFSMKENLSEYGHTNKQEFFAECFANSQLSEPNELGQAMNQWLEQKGLC